MKFTLTIEGDNPSDLQYITSILSGRTNEANSKATVAVVETAASEGVTVAPAVVVTEPAPKKGPGRPKKDTAPAEPVQAAADDAVADADEERIDVTTASDADLEDEAFLIAVRKFAQDTKSGGGVPATQAILATFKDADGKPVARVNSVQKQDRRAVLIKIADAVASATKKAK
jgi:hypothetical protein